MIITAEAARHLTFSIQWHSEYRFAGLDTMFDYICSILDTSWHEMPKAEICIKIADGPRVFFTLRGTWQGVMDFHHFGLAQL